MKGQRRERKGGGGREKRGSIPALLFSHLKPCRSESHSRVGEDSPEGRRQFKVGRIYETGEENER